MLAGHNDGACTGSAYSDPYGNWKNDIVLGSQNYLTRLHRHVGINTNRVHLKNKPVN